MQALKLAEKHILAVSKERSYFRTVVKDSKDVVKLRFTTNDTFAPPSPHSYLHALTNDICVHYSVWLCTAGAHTIKPTTTGPNLFSHAPEVWDIWCLLWGNSSPNQLLDRRGGGCGQGIQHSCFVAAPLLRDTWSWRVTCTSARGQLCWTK